jgi:DNA-binding HxlR family transcriptional regulator
MVMFEKKLDKKACNQNLMAVRDAWDALNSKWKLPIIVVLSEGPMRYNELQRALDGITPRSLSRELKDLEMNGFLSRVIHYTPPVKVEYVLTDYSNSLQEVIEALKDWGSQHRKRITGQ